MQPDSSHATANEVASDTVASDSVASDTVASDTVASDLTVDGGRCPIERLVEQRFEDEVGMELMGMAQ